MAQPDAAWYNSLIKTPGCIPDRKTIIDPLWHGFIEMNSYDPIANQMILMERYEQAMGIQNNETKHPITLVTLKDATNVENNGLLEATITRIMKTKLCELTNMSIVELLELPTYVLKMLFKTATIVKSDTPSHDYLAKLLVELQEALNK